MAIPGAAYHEGSSADAETIVKVLARAVHAVEAGGIPYVLVGGMASSALGRRRCSSDIDLLVMPEHARPALAVLEAEGFTTEETNPHWLFKAFRDEVLVDVLFKSTGEIYLDEEMLSRSTRRPVRGTPVRVVSAEDLLVMKALAHNEECPRHWFDAMGLLAANRLDWEYVLRRARSGPPRVLSLLLYATSVGLSVPGSVIARLFHESCAHASVGLPRERPER